MKFFYGQIKLNAVVFVLTKMKSNCFGLKWQKQQKPNHTKQTNSTICQTKSVVGIGLGVSLKAICSQFRFFLFLFFLFFCTRSRNVRCVVFFNVAERFDCCWNQRITFFFSCFFVSCRVTLHPLTIFALMYPLFIELFWFCLFNFRVYAEQVLWVNVKKMPIWRVEKMNKSV